MRTIAASGQAILVDDDDHEWLGRRTWCIDDDGYPRTRIGAGYSRMHRLILGTPYVDHRDGNTLNNQRSNLRECTQQQNIWNSASHRGSSSRFKGVSFHRRTGKWQAELCVNRKRTHLGTFNSEAEAAVAYNLAAERAFGEYARLNDV